MTGRRAVALAAALALGACGQAPAPPVPDRPLRVVSLDYCADQYVLELMPRERIAAVSPDAAKPFSYKRRAAAGLRQVSPRAEDVLLLRPDLIVRSYGGGPEAARFFADAGIPVLQIGWAEDLAGVRARLIEVADGLGESARGRALAARFDARLAAIGPAEARPRAALYMTPGGVTTGPGTLIDAMFRAAGLANFEAAPGWRALPLERLAYRRPELVAHASFGQGTTHIDAWSAARHPIARAQLAERPVVALDGAWTACGGWFLLDAVEALGRAGA